ncbi:unnamed protein product [Amoebophrya sp. A120]|nr:unnamed protein product [Amoebophrya sp. A120]|eukprot:GSA120T00008362001.1
MWSQLTSSGRGRAASFLPRFSLFKSSETSSSKPAPISRRFSGKWLQQQAEEAAGRQVGIGKGNYSAGRVSSSTGGTGGVSVPGGSTGGRVAFSTDNSATRGSATSIGGANYSATRPFSTTTTASSTSTTSGIKDKTTASPPPRDMFYEDLRGTIGTQTDDLPCRTKLELARRALIAERQLVAALRKRVEDLGGVLADAQCNGEELQKCAELKNEMQQRAVMGSA